MLPPSDSPDWQPLLDFAGGHVDDFMWMFEVELEGGIRLHAYKHWWTRRYIHLAADGRAFAFEPNSWDEDDESSWYHEVDPKWLFDLVLPHGRHLADYLQVLERARQDSNLWPPLPESGALSS
jgi:hypothetical protein